MIVNNNQLDTMEYYRDNFLTKTQKVLYDKCFLPWFKEGISNESDERVFKIKLKDISGDDINESVIAVMRDHPEIICLKPIKKNTDLFRYYFSYDGESLDVRFYNQYRGFSYAYEETERKRIQKETDSIINEVVKKANELKDDYSKILFFADYFVTNCIYLENTAAHSSEGLINGRIVCEGIANSFKTMCDRVGIWCIVVTGDAGDPEKKDKWEPHGWNIVKLGDRYYHVDATWALTSCTMKSASMGIRTMTHDELPRIKFYDFMFMSDDDVKNNRNEDHIYPKCTDPSMEYYRKNGLITHLDKNNLSLIDDEQKIIDQLRYNRTPSSKVYVLRTRLLKEDGTYPKDNEIERYITVKIMRKILGLTKNDWFSATYDSSMGNYCITFIKN